MRLVTLLESAWLDLYVLHNITNFQRRS